MSDQLLGIALQGISLLATALFAVWRMGAHSQAMRSEVRISTEALAGRVDGLHQAVERHGDELRTLGSEVRDVLRDHEKRLGTFDGRLEHLRYSNRNGGRGE